MMKIMISSKDQSEFRKWGNLLTLLLLITIISAVPLTFILDWLGMITWVVIWIVTMVVAYRVEKLKKKNNIRTFLEIVSFMDARKLDEIQKAREDGKYVYQKGYILIVIILISMIITYGMIKFFS